MGDPLFESNLPFWKFVSVKGLVFFTFWQSMGFSMLVQYGVIVHTDFWSADNIEAGLEDFTICIEMFFFALAHKYCFTSQPFKELLENPLTDSNYDIEADVARRASARNSDNSLFRNFTDLFNAREVMNDAGTFRDIATRPLRELESDSSECCRA